MEFHHIRLYLKNTNHTIAQCHAFCLAATHWLRVDFFFKWRVLPFEMTFHFQMHRKDVLVVHLDKMAPEYQNNNFGIGKRCRAAVWGINCFPYRSAIQSCNILKTQVFSSEQDGRWYLICCTWELHRLPPVSWSCYSNSKAFLKMPHH